MRDLPDSEYVAALAGQLRHAPTISRATEDELARMRHVMTRVAAFINNPAHDHATRAALAEHLGLPAPRTTTPSRRTT